MRDVIGIETPGEIRTRNPDDLDALTTYHIVKNVTRVLLLFAYLAYCTVLEASPLRGSIGKWAMGIAVVSITGRRVTRTQAIRRNCTKAGSLAAFGIGCFAVCWSPLRQGWHDRDANTLVIER